ncbi:MAG: DUF3877 family protein [Eubacterium sp.]|nr:DUF3877 family protein [Eubacterium sp.]
MLERKEHLEKNIIEQIQEAQLKLGFVKETVRLYYPLDSLNAILNIHCQEGNEMCIQLASVFPDFTFGCRGERVEISVPPDYVEYVHREVKTPAFLAEMIARFQENQHLTFQQVQQIFAEFGEYECQKMPEGADFDYVLYFENPDIDSYYYCIRMEMGHTIYHRFMKEDYEQLIL